MGINRQKVQEWLNENFILDAIVITEMPLVPGGVIITDKNRDKALVYLDVATNTVRVDILTDTDSMSSKIGL